MILRYTFKAIQQKSTHMYDVCAKIEKGRENDKKC